MKQYRFQCWAAGLYFNSVVNAATDEDAIGGFAQNLNQGLYSVEKGDLGRGVHRWHITYEELGNGTTGVNIEETRAGVQMGTASVVTG
jgi:hypothetical protein